MTFWQFHPNVKLRVGMNFITGMLSNMVIPFMAVYFAKTLGTTAAGLAATASIVTGLIAATWGGHYSDRIGRKKLMLLSEAAAAAIYTLMALANSPWFHSPWITLVMTVLVSVSWGLSKPATEAMLVDVTTPETRKSMYRITYWLNNMSLSIAGIAGAFLFSDYLFQLLLAVAAISLISFFVTLWFISETHPGHTSKDQGKPREGRLLSTYRVVLRDRAFMIYIAASMLLLSVEINLTNYIGVRLSREMRDTPWFGGTVNGLEMLGFLRTENTLLVVILSFVVGYVVRNRKESTVLYGGLLMNIAGYSYLAVSNHPTSLVAAMLIATFGELMYVPIKQASLAQMIPDHARSAYMAVTGFTYRGGMLLCSLNIILGGFIHAIGMGMLILFTGILGMVLLYSVLPKPEAQPSLPAKAAG